jgi:hypothetical protein
LGFGQSGERRCKAVQFDDPLILQQWFAKEATSISATRALLMIALAALEKLTRVPTIGSAFW